jgi:hypothetical protein
VLILDGVRLLAARYPLAEYSDIIWGEGKCDWEQEVAVSREIAPLSRFLIRVEPVAEQRMSDYRERGPIAFQAA